MIASSRGGNPVASEGVAPHRDQYLSSSDAMVAECSVVWYSRVDERPVVGVGRVVGSTTAEGRDAPGRDD